jgi:hypothetical protein
MVVLHDCKPVLSASYFPISHIRLFPLYQFQEDLSIVKHTWDLHLGYVILFYSTKILISSFSKLYTRAGNVAQLIEISPSMCKVMGSIASIEKKEEEKKRKLSIILFVNKLESLL